MNTQDTQLLEELASIAEQYTVNAPKEVFRAFPNWGTELSVVLRNQTAEQIETALAGLESTDDASGKEKVASSEAMMKSHVAAAVSPAHRARGAVGQAG